MVVPNTAVILDDRTRIPVEVHTLAGFRAWVRSEGFPEATRIDFLGGDVEVEMAPEDLYTHGAAKTEIAAELQLRVGRSGAGVVFVDRARVTVPDAGLSVEPDVAVVFWESLQSGRIREIPSASGVPGRFVEVEGPPDLVVEVISDGSEHKDRERLPARYARAGVPELWLVDARGDSPTLEILTLEAGSYRTVPSADGWVSSPRLEATFRLTRSSPGGHRWTYRLESRQG